MQAACIQYCLPCWGLSLGPRAFQQVLFTQGEALPPIFKALRIFFPLSRNEPLERKFKAMSGPYKSYTFFQVKLRSSVKWDEATDLGFSLLTGHPANTQRFNISHPQCGSFEGFFVCFFWISESMVREFQLPVLGRGPFLVGLFFVYRLILSSRWLDDTYYFLWYFDVYSLNKWDDLI